MTDEERLQEYLRQNTPKAKKVEAPVPKVSTPVRSKSKKTPTEWYYGRVIPEFVTIMGFATFFPAIILGWLNSEWRLEKELAWTLGIAISGAALVVMSFVTINRLIRYSRWRQNRYYKVTGWEEFFVNRTADFWKQRNYTNIRITINLAPGASDLHREVVKTFTASIIRKWNKQYQDKDLEWIGSVPKDLNTDGRAIYGDISQREMPWVIKIFVKFIPLSRLLKDHLVEVVISSNAKEKTHEMKEVKDDPSDRADDWMRRHSG